MIRSCMPFEIVHFKRVKMNIVTSSNNNYCIISFKFTLRNFSEAKNDLNYNFEVKISFRNSQVPRSTPTGSIKI